MFISRGVMFTWDLLFCLFKCITSNEKEIFASSKFTVFCLSFDWDLSHDPQSRLVTSR